MESAACPVCTLYLREGMSMQSHLSTHPKDQVIEALVRLCGGERVTFPQQSSLVNHPFVQIISEQQVVMGRQQVTNVFQPQLMTYPLYQGYYVNPDFVEGDVVREGEQGCSSVKVYVEEERSASPQTVHDGSSIPSDSQVLPDDLSVQKTEAVHVGLPSPGASNHSGISVRTDLQERPSHCDQFHDEDARHGPDMSNPEGGIYSDDEEEQGKKNVVPDAAEDSSSELNIESDELMPPSGEISGQEPHTALVGTVWITEDGPVSEEAVWEEGAPTLETKKRYQCLYCNLEFDCPKERRLHIATYHASSDTKNGFSASATVTTESKPAFCIKCDFNLPSLKALKEHNRSVHGRLSRQCGVCKEVFCNQELYSEHLIKVHPLECTTCGKTFPSKARLSLHSKTHLKVKPHPCNICNKSFITPLKLREHMNGHTGFAPLQCNMCEKSFKRYSNLKQHKNLTHFNYKRKAKEFFCECGESFPTVKKLEWHKETHSTKPKQCMHCSERYIHNSSLTRHIRRSHDKMYVPPESVKSKNVECQVCHLVFLESSLKAHMRQHMVHKPFGCIICGKRFRTKWNLHLHKWTHAPRVTKPYKCNQCKSAFIRFTDYQAHIRSHYGQKPFTCNHCGMKFNRKQNCQRHEKEHTSEKSYKCKVCDKSFHRSYYLLEHSRIHTGVKPYTCHVCNKTSTTKSNHNKHVRTHHAREPVNTEG